MSPNNNYLYIVLALITGALIPIQAATNTAFSKSIGNPFITGLVVFLIGLAGMLLFLVITRTSVPEIGKFAKAPLYGYLGGIIVATYVVMITIITPKIGVGSAIGFIVTGQIICAVIIDHFGLFNMTVRTVDAGRIFGVLLMMAGIYFVMRKSVV